MDTWLIVLITVGSGLALFIAILYYKTKQEKKRQERMTVNQTTMGVHVVTNNSSPYNPNFPQQPNQNYYNQPQMMMPQPQMMPQLQPQQGQLYIVNTSIPSTANQGAFTQLNSGRQMTNKVIFGPII